MRVDPSVGYSVLVANNERQFPSQGIKVSQEAYAPDIGLEMVCINMTNVNFHLFCFCGIRSPQAGFWPCRRIPHGGGRWELYCHRGCHRYCECPRIVESFSHGAAGLMLDT